MFTIEDIQLGFYFLIHFEDGMISEVFANNPIAFFRSRKVDSSNQVKTVMAVNIQTYELNISIQIEGKNDKMSISLNPQTAKSIFNVAKLYQHQKSVPDFSYKKICELTTR